MPLEVDAGIDETHTFAPQPRRVSLECRPPRGVDHPMARDAVVSALPHHIPDRTRRTWTPREHPDHSVGRDPARRDALDDVVDGLRPIGGSHAAIMPKVREPYCGDD